MRVVFVGSSTAAQTTVSDSPVYGKVAPPAECKSGILVLAADLDAPLRVVKWVALPKHVGFIATHASNGCVYAAVAPGELYAFRCAADGGLQQIGAAVSALGNPVYLELSSCGRWALVANYSAGTVASFPIRADGTLGDCADSKLHGPLAGSFALFPELADRQEKSHPHMIKLCETTERAWALVPDLGADRVWVYAFDRQTGAFRGAANSARHLALPKGSGPRHLAFHPNGKWVYVLCELDGNMVACAWDASSGSLSAFCSTQSLPEGTAPCRAHHSGGAHVVCAPDGKTVYATTRTDGALVTFAVESTGALRRVASVSCGGVCPRNFHLDAEAGRLCVGNQDSQTVASFPVAADGSLSQPELLSLGAVCPTVLAPPYTTP